MKFNYRQLIFVREYLGYTQTELASHITGLSQSNLSKYEKGIGGLSEDILGKIVDFLGFPEEFFALSISNNVENAHYRRKSNLTKKTRSQIEYSNKLIGYIIDEMSDTIEFPEFMFRTIDIEDGYTPEYIAGYTRKLLGVKDGPVRNICSLLENFGVIIVEANKDVDVFDGVSFLTDKGFCVMVINRNFSNDHKRFTIAHELGHIIMHLSPEFPIPEYRNKEDEAHRFASEFLMPETQIYNSLAGLKLQYLMPLKDMWLTSMASIVRRAKDLKCISPEKYKYFNIELSRKGYKRQEPGNVFIDSPSSYYDAFGLLRNELGYSDSELSTYFNLPIDVIKEYCMYNTTFLRVVGVPNAKKP